MSTDSDRTLTIYIAACPSCGVDVPWHAKQFTAPTPKCSRCPALKKSKQIKP